MILPQADAWTGGPDGCGYTGRDDLAPPNAHTPTYNWVDLTGTGTGLAHGDDTLLTVTLPFTFTYCGVAYTSIQTSSNGYMCFGTSATNCFVYYGSTIPNAGSPYPAVYGYNTDLNPSTCASSTSTSCTLWQVQGTAPNRVFIYMMKTVPYYSGAGTLTFEFKLYENAGTASANFDPGCIDVHYQSVADTGSHHVMGGITQSGTTGMAYFDTTPGPTHASRAVRYCQTTTPPPTCAPAVQTVAPGPVAFSATSGAAPLSWSAPGGTPSSQAPATPGNTFGTSYSAAGTYIVTVTDSVGNSSNCTVNVVIPGCGYTITTGAAVYSWTEISATGTPMTGFGDYTVQNVPAGPAPFNFQFCGSTYSHIFPVSEGHICLGTTTAPPPSCSTCCPYSPSSNVPSTLVNRPAIFAYYSDLYPPNCAGGSGACMFYQTIGTAPNRVMVYEWKGVPYYFNGAQLTFQAKLFETTNCIEVHYQNVVTGGGNNLAGYQNAGGGAAYTYSYGSGGFNAAGTAWQACPDPPATSIARDDPQGVSSSDPATQYQGTEDMPVTVMATYPPAGPPYTGCGLTSGLLCNDNHTIAASTPTILVDPTSFGTGSLGGTLTAVDTGANTLQRGAFLYTPNPNVCGTKSFTYKAKDTVGLLSNQATAYIYLQCTHDGPIAVADTYTFNEGTTFVVNPNSACTSGVNYDLLCNDIDPDTGDVSTLTAGLKDTLGPANQVILCTQPTYGVVTLSAGSPSTGGGFTYTPNPGAGQDYYGVDTFTYKLRDGRMDGVVVETPCVTVTLNIMPVQDAPVAQNDPCPGATCPGGNKYRAYYNHTLRIRADAGVLANDYDVDNLPASNTGLTVSCTGLCTMPASQGILTVYPDGAFVYAPPPFQVTCQTVTFQYRAVDTTGLQSNVATASLYVCPRYPPVSLPYASPLEITVGQSVTFGHNSYTPGPLGAISGVLWNFGDGLTSTEETPTHTYAQPGGYTVKLTAYSHLNDPGDGFVRINVNYPPDPTGAPASWLPVADAGSDMVVAPGARVQVAGQAQGSPEARFEWRQIGGVAVDLVGTNQPVVSFVAPQARGGDALVRLGLRVTSFGATSAEDTVDIIVRVPNGVPVVRAPSISGLPGQRIMLDASASYDPEGDPLTFRWQQTAGEPAVFVTNDVANPVIILPSKGSSTALVFMVEASDGVDAGQATVEVRMDALPGGGPPIVSKTTGSSIWLYTRVPGETYVWDFGDGSHGQGADVQHTYAEAGAYMVSLMVIDAQGNERVFGHEVTAATPLAGQAGDPGVQATAPGFGIVTALLLLGATAVVSRRRA